MDWGFKNRLNKVLPGMKEGSGSVMFAIDHGYFMGPTTGLENPRETIVPLLPHADSLMLSRGILQNSIHMRFHHYLTMENPSHHLCNYFS